MWQIIIVNNVKLSCREVRHQLGQIQNVISCFVRKYQQTNNVMDRNHKTFPVEDSVLLWIVWHCPFSNSMILKDNWIPKLGILMRTIRNWLKNAGYWCQEAYQTTPSDTTTQNCMFSMVSGMPQMESCIVEKHSLVWWKPLFNILFGGGSLMVWECVLHDCSLDLVTVQNILNGPKYQRDILETCCPSLWQSCFGHETCVYGCQC